MKNPQMQRRFTPTAFTLMGGLLIWITNFVFVYSFAAVACARGFAHLETLGIRIVPLVTTSATCLSFAATVALLVMARRRGRARSDASTQFIEFVAMATGGLALVALVFLALPPLLTSSCRT